MVVPHKILQRRFEEATELVPPAFAPTMPMVAQRFGETHLADHRSPV
jgi:hypothetical protein